ncbi:cephalosporin-C deacetylase [Ligilactobacillus ruminis DPC 6832]|uniref:Cephalosporin-C deacetylase n=1 Tax=Ligilactobacillus ruminis DPC 6832 TaxID=1402208 RepID=A0A837DUL0_9LACO|nr:cephalosporin-C deacetylase [Ligilactobacillus ruminis DPC 6832]
MHKNEDEFFRLLDYVDVKYLAENIKAEVVMVVGLKDTVVFPKTQMAAFYRIKSRKRLLVLPEYGHEYLPKISDELREFFEFGK